MQIVVNFWAVLAAAIIANVIGMAWYSPKLFGNVWMHLSGITPEKIEEGKKKSMAANYIINFVGSLVMAYVLGHFAIIGNVYDIAGAWSLAFWAWLGFIVTSFLGSVLWEGKPWKLYILNVAYYLVSLFAMALVLTFWR